MKIKSLFSKREKTVSVPQPTALVYDHIPKELRVQISYTIENLFIELRSSGRVRYDGMREVILAPSPHLYQEAVRSLKKAYGVLELNPTLKKHYSFPKSELDDFIYTTQHVNRIFDLLEISAHLSLDAVENTRNSSHLKTVVEELKELNDHLSEHSIGYELDIASRQLVKRDSPYIHDEAVRPALHLLGTKGYQGSLDKFSKAHEHYRNGLNKEAINEATKAYESTMITICERKSWELPRVRTTTSLVNTCLDNKLVPKYWQDSLTQLGGLLSSSVNVPRNKNAAHGQGVTIQDAPSELVSYVLHMTASTIVYLIKSAERLENQQ